MRVLFCGFMGAGKSYFLQRMSNNSSDLWQFADLDQMIFQREQPAKMTVGELVKAKGWDYFRSRESKLLSEYLEKNENCFLALGGGALSTESNLECIRGFENSRLVWLNTSFETCYQRILDDKIERPLLEMGKEKLLELFKNRQSDYLNADLILDEREQGLINCLTDLTIRLSVSN